MVAHLTAVGHLMHGSRRFAAASPGVFYPGSSIRSAPETHNSTMFPELERIYYRHGELVLTGRDIYQAALAARKAKIKATSVSQWLAFIFSLGMIKGFNPAYISADEIGKQLEGMFTVKKLDITEPEDFRHALTTGLKRLKHHGILERTLILPLLTQEIDERWHVRLPGLNVS